MIRLASAAWQGGLWDAQEVLVNPMGVLDMGVNLMSVRDSWKQHHHALEAGERSGCSCC